MDFCIRESWIDCIRSTRTLNLTLLWCMYEHGDVESKKSTSGRATAVASETVRWAQLVVYSKAFALQRLDKWWNLYTTLYKKAFLFAIRNENELKWMIREQHVLFPIIKALFNIYRPYYINSTFYLDFILQQEHVCSYVHMYVYLST